jgi:hypothetical protein
MREETMKLQKEREEIEKEKAKLIALKSGISMGQISIKAPNHKCRLFFKINQ